MRVVFAVLMILFAFSAPVYAQSAAKCANVDMGDPEAIKACLESDSMWYEARTKPMFEPNKDCGFLQMMVVKYKISSTDAKAGNRVNSKTLDDETIERPSCDVVSDVVELIRQRPSAWSPCLGYDEADDKFEHFKYCVVKYQQLRYNQPNKMMGKTDCKNAIATYQQALGQIYPPRQEEGAFYGRKLPASYTDLDCAQVDAFFAAVNEEEMAELEKRHQEAMAFKAQRRAIKEQKALEALEKAKRTQEFNDHMAESYQRAIDQMDEEMYGPGGMLARVNDLEHPKDTIENKHIRRAIIKEMQRIVPEEEKTVMGITGKIEHTSGGFKSRLVGSHKAPIYFFGVDNAKIKKCDVAKGKAICTYDITLFTNVDNGGAGNMEGVMDSLYKLSGAGPRTTTFESVLKHDGKQWTTTLTQEQTEFIFPPPPTPSEAEAAQKQREKTHCDTMSALGIPMMC